MDFSWQYYVGKAARRTNNFAASILRLKPATHFEVELKLSDPDGGQATRYVYVSTHPIPSKPRHSKTYHVVPSQVDGSKDRPFRGIAAAQLVATPGSNFMLHPGHYGRVRLDVSGSPGDRIAGNYVV